MKTILVESSHHSAMVSTAVCYWEVPGSNPRKGDNLLISLIQIIMDLYTHIITIGWHGIFYIIKMAYFGLSKKAFYTRGI